VDREAVGVGDIAKARYRLSAERETARTPCAPSLHAVQKSIEETEPCPDEPTFIAAAFSAPQP
jgi:hypothetical protein